MAFLGLVIVGVSVRNSDQGCRSRRDSWLTLPSSLCPNTFFLRNVIRVGAPRPVGVLNQSFRVIPLGIFLLPTCFNGDRFSFQRGDHVSDWSRKHGPFRTFLFFASGNQLVKSLLIEPWKNLGKSALKRVWFLSERETHASRNFWSNPESTRSVLASWSVHFSVREFFNFARILIFKIFSFFFNRFRYRFRFIFLLIKNYQISD